MSRGGRGGGRGGRGGARGGGPQLPWENEEIDSRPSELFPKYEPPTAKSLDPSERRAVDAFLLLRRQIHDGPLYTSRKLPGPTSVTASSSSYRGKRAAADMSITISSRSSRATVDPFTAVPTYSQRFVRTERTLPDFTLLPYCDEFVPDELRPTFEGRDAEKGILPASAVKKRKRMQLSRITALPNAKEVFGMNGGDHEEEEEEENGIGSEARKKRTLEALQRLEEEPSRLEGEEGDELDDEDRQEEEQDEEYDDEDAGDYDAENYFDGGDDDYDDGGDDDQGGDTY